MDEIVQQRHYTVREAADITGYEYRQVMYRIRSGKIEAEKIGWVWILDHKQLEELILLREKELLRSAKRAKRKAQRKPREK